MAKPQSPHKRPSATPQRPRRKAQKILSTPVPLARSEHRRGKASVGISRASAPASNVTDTPPAKSKQSMIAAMVQRKGGASIADLMASTGWQAHSVRAVLSGLRKAGQQIERHRGDDGVTRYRASAST